MQSLLDQVVEADAREVLRAEKLKLCVEMSCLDPAEGAVGPPRLRVHLQGERVRRPQQAEPRVDEAHARVPRDAPRLIVCERACPGVLLLGGRVYREG